MKTIIKDIIAFNQSQRAKLPKMGLKDTFLVIIGKKKLEPEVGHLDDIPETLHAARDAIGPERLRVEIGDILLWLKSMSIEARTNSPSPLRIRQTEGVGQLRLYQLESTTALLDSTPELSELFEIQNRLLCFRSEVPQGEREEISDFVDRNHAIPLQK